MGNDICKNCKDRIQEGKVYSKKNIHSAWYVIISTFENKVSYRKMNVLNIQYEKDIGFDIQIKTVDEFLNEFQYETTVFCEHMFMIDKCKERKVEMNPAVVQPIVQNNNKVIKYIGENNHEKHENSLYLFTEKHENSLYLFTGDINQMMVQKEFLIGKGFNIKNNNVYPGVESEYEFEKALSLIWMYEIEGWWHYFKEYEKYKICTQEEFETKLSQLK